jgi:hypothetical protein
MINKLTTAALALAIAFIFTACGGKQEYSGELSFNKITYNPNSKVYTITGNAAKFITDETESGAPEYEYGENVSVSLPAGTKIRSYHAEGKEVTVDNIYNDYQKKHPEFETYPFIYNTKTKTLSNIGN